MIHFMRRNIFVFHIRFTVVSHSFHSWKSVLIICKPMLSMMSFKLSRATSACLMARIEMKFSAQKRLASWPRYMEPIWDPIANSFPMTDPCMPYMVTWIPSIYPSHVSIYASTMDPMGDEGLKDAERCWFMENWWESFFFEQLMVIENHGRTRHKSLNRGSWMWICNLMSTSLMSTSVLHWFHVKQIPWISLDKKWQLWTRAHSNYS